MEFDVSQITTLRQKRGWSQVDLAARTKSVDTDGLTKWAIIEIERALRSGRVPNIRPRTKRILALTFATHPVKAKRSA